ncbi:MAG: carboxymuconolactone decarboxylase family protein [Candidatus Geothermincolia bacterium]
MSIGPPFLRKLGENDPEFHGRLCELMGYVNSPGELDAKTKILVSLALDAAFGAAEGVRALSIAARSAGASEAEIREVLRQAFLMGGIPAAVASMEAWPD